MAKRTRHPVARISGRPVYARRSKKGLGLLLARSVLTAHGGLTAFRMELLRDPETERREASWQGSEL